ncbi:MAG: hypothetical protein HYY06_26415 [Deltaproteobacteria bacterium]|nr:hypothetical protein [Deltaproteobacteria bacterium]
MKNVDREARDGAATPLEDLGAEIEELESQVAAIRARIAELEALRARAGEDPTRKVDVPSAGRGGSRPADVTEVASAPPEIEASDSEAPSREDPTLRDSSASRERAPSIPSALERMAKRVLGSSVGGPLVWRVAENDLTPMAAVLDGEGAALAAYLLATVRARLEDLEGAEAALRQAWSRTGGDPLIALGLGEHLLRVGEPADAVAYLDLALRANLGSVRPRGEVETLLAEARARARRVCCPGREDSLQVDDDQIEVIEEAGVQVSGGRAGRQPMSRDDFAGDTRGAIEALVATLADDPGQLDAVESLLHLCEKVGAEAQRSACASLLGLLDPRRPSAPGPSAEDSTRAPISRAEAEALLPVPSREPARLGALLWEHAPTLFRADLRAFGVSPASRLSPLDESPLAVLWAIARRCLDLPRTAVFVRPEGSEIEVAPTLPPSVVCGRELRLDSSRERFRVVRAIASTRAEHLLWSALPADRSWPAYDALRWAFGRADDVDTSIARAAVLGKEYRRLLPPRVQRDLRERMRSVDLPDFATVRRLGSIAVHRAALLVTRDLGAALEVVAAEEPELGGSDLGRRAGLAAAIRRSELAGELVRFAVCEGYGRLRGADPHRFGGAVVQKPPSSLGWHA